MRDLVLKRINEIKIKENNFSKGIMKWNNFSNGAVTKHISEIKWEELNDYELVILFERLIRRYNQQG